MVVTNRLFCKSTLEDEKMMEAEVLNGIAEVLHERDTGGVE